MASSSRNHVNSRTAMERFGEMPILVENGINRRKLSDHSNWRIRWGGWTRFTEPPRGRINVSLVREFYANLARTPNVHDTYSVRVRGQLVPWTPRDIGSAISTTFLTLPPFNHYEDHWKIQDPRYLWNHVTRALNSLAPNRPSQRDSTLPFLTQDMRAWKKFINSRVLPSLNPETLTDEELLLLYAIQHDENIDWGRLIHRVAVEFAKNEDYFIFALPFASVISYLCIERAHIYQHDNDEYFPSTDITVGRIPVGAPGISSPEPSDSGEDSDMSSQASCEYI